MTREGATQGTAREFYAQTTVAPALKTTSLQRTHRSLHPDSPARPHRPSSFLF